MSLPVSKRGKNSSACGKAERYGSATAPIDAGESITITGSEGMLIVEGDIELFGARKRDIGTAGGWAWTANCRPRHQGQEIDASAGNSSSPFLTAARKRVLVLEQSFVGAGATAAGMGHIVVMDDSPAQLALTTYSRGMLDEIAGELSASCERDACGTLWIAEDAAQLVELEHKRRRHEAAGVACDVLDERALAAAAVVTAVGGRWGDTAVFGGNRAAYTVSIDDNGTVDTAGPVLTVTSPGCASRRAARSTSTSCRR